MKENEEKKYVYICPSCKGHKLEKVMDVETVSIQYHPEILISKDIEEQEFLEINNFPIKEDSIFANYHYRIQCEYCGRVLFTADEKEYVAEGLDWEDDLMKYIKLNPEEFEEIKTIEK